MMSSGFTFLHNARELGWVGVVCPSWQIVRCRESACWVAVWTEKQEEIGRAGWPCLQIIEVKA